MIAGFQLFGQINDRWGAPFAVFPHCFAVQKDDALIITSHGERRLGRIVPDTKRFAKVTDILFAGIG
jgi:hypothetical protein